ncbi:MAG: LLM class F420-dependent oxidoreductase [Deltaproteobacteria bacterium]|nr:LLM class F420-dependent oxidoreductase [Deltaproteobacteria bacterium]MBW2418316.1 LLM class F420-dependent oxidoreductase [Deltaproteobacteria bacterium]
MRIGVMSGASPGPDATLDRFVERAKDLEARGFHSMWMANIFNHDAITVQAIIGRETERIELGTAVVPSYPRHPIAMAQQCLTAQSASRGRFVLGVGLSHQLVIEGMFGLSYDKPARHMREYMAVLGPLLRGEPVKFEGNEYRVNLALDVPDAVEVPVIIAALGDHMLKIAGRTASGTILWMTGPKTIAGHIVPKLQAAASEAGRPEPRVVCGLPTVLTNDPDTVRERIAKSLAMYGQLPSYRAMLDKEGLAGPADIALVGDEKELDASLARLADAGVTDFDAAIIPVEDDADERTLDYLTSRL